MRKLDVAVVGVGFWGFNHARVFKELPNTELVAVCDTDQERAKSVAEKFGVRSYTDSRELLKQEAVEAVSLCTWSTALPLEAKRALRAGKHVFVEKPMANTAKEAEKIVDLARERGLHLTVGFIERFNSGVQRIKEMIQKGAIGDVVSATARRVGLGPRRWPEQNMDVGVVKDTAIHDIDIMRHLFAQDPMAVYAKTGNLRHRALEDYAQIMLTFRDGKTAFIEANWLTPYKVRNLLITGSEATVYLQYLTQEITIETLGQSLTPRHKWEEPLKLELENFAECILNNKENLVTGVDGLKALQIAEAALKSAAKCKTIKLE